MLTGIFEISGLNVVNMQISGNSGSCKLAGDSLPVRAVQTKATDRPISRHITKPMLNDWIIINSLLAMLLRVCRMVKQCLSRCVLRQQLQR